MSRYGPSQEAIEAGNAGAPSHNQNAIKHGLNSDPHHYFQSLPSQEKEWVRAVREAIQQRVLKNTGNVDRLDLELSHQIAVEFHILSRAEDYIANNGLTQRDGTRESTAALLKEVRRYGTSIMRNLEDIGALD